MPDTNFYTNMIDVSKKQEASPEVLVARKVIPLLNQTMDKFHIHENLFEQFGDMLLRHLHFVTAFGEEPPYINSALQKLICAMLGHFLEQMNATPNEQRIVISNQN